MKSTNRQVSARLGTTLLTTAIFATTLSVVAQEGPAPASVHLPADVLSLACAPKLVSAEPMAPLRVTGGQDVTARQVFVQGDLITINAGRQNGMEVGQEFFVRRTLVEQQQPITPLTPAAVRTAGWIRIYAVDDVMSLATITYGCDQVFVDDYLEPFVVPVVPAPAKVRGKPERDNYGRVVVGNDRRYSFGKGDYLVVDRGTDHGIFPGAHLVFYHDKGKPGNFLFEVGEAVAVEVGVNTSTLQVTLSRDAIAVNDYVSLRKPAENR